MAGHENGRLAAPAFGIPALVHEREDRTATIHGGVVRTRQ
jgi:hypothetical protein